MSNKGKKILAMLLVIILLITIVVVANIFIRNQKIERVDINISYGKSDTIITVGALTKDLTAKFGDFKNRERKNIEGKDVEEFLMKNQYLEDVQVFQNLKGILKIEIKQSEPLVRIHTIRNQEYYIDKRGKFIEIMGSDITDVVVANGFIDINSKILDKRVVDTIKIQDKKGFERSLSNIYKIAQKLQNDSILNYQIDQIYLNKDGSYELIPKIGNYLIRINENEDLEAQFTKLSYLYKEGFSKIGWDNYSVVDLRFRNQVVCTKKFTEQASKSQTIEKTTINKSEQNIKIN